MHFVMGLWFRFVIMQVCIVVDLYSAVTACFVLTLLYLFGFLENTFQYFFSTWPGINTSLGHLAASGQTTKNKIILCNVWPIVSTPAWPFFFLMHLTRHGSSPCTDFISEKWLTMQSITFCHYIVLIWKILLFVACDESYYQLNLH